MDNEELRQLQVIWVMESGRGGIEPGSFYKALIKAAIFADKDNTAKLAQVFPYVVGAVRAWQTGEGIDNYPVIKEYIEKSN